MFVGDGNSLVAAFYLVNTPTRGGGDEASVYLTLDGFKWINGTVYPQESAYMESFILAAVLFRRGMKKTPTQTASWYSKAC